MSAILLRQVFGQALPYHLASRYVIAIFATLPQPDRDTVMRTLLEEIEAEVAPPAVSLIRGFGVRVPGGAPTIEALTWWFSPDQSRLHVHDGRLGAPWVL
jgi:hypothetical protein